jgi:hypothetical protein
MRRLLGGFPLSLIGHTGISPTLFGAVILHLQ